eukprot:s4938_g1.t1
MPALPTDTVEKVDKSLNDEHLPVLAKVSQLFTCLADNGLGYYQKAAPKDTLTHPANRGGSLLNSTDVRSKGLRMLSSGVQPAMLQSGAVCFELSNVKEKGESQIAANASLVEGSNNSLTPVAGQERFLTVATSQNAAFCKADQAPADNNSDLSVKDAMTDALFEGAFVIFNSLLNLTKSPSKSGSVQALPAAYRGLPLPSGEVPCQCKCIVIEFYPVHGVLGFVGDHEGKSNVSVPARDLQLSGPAP